MKNKRGIIVVAALVGLYILLTVVGVTGIPSKCYLYEEDVHLCDSFFTVDFWLTDRPNSEFGFEYINIW